MSANLSAILYLVSGVLFILALRGLSSPETSRQGNLFGIIGMIIAVTVTFLSVGNFSSGFVYVLIFLAIGGSIGAFIAYRIPMTAMPELVRVTTAIVQEDHWLDWTWAPRPQRGADQDEEAESGEESTTAASAP